MIRRIATVGGLTLVSRLTGFVRDVVMAAILGAGPIADAFFVAFRLPNHFRAIFAEGAFAASFVPAYARTLEEAGLPAAKLFADQIAAALIAINLVNRGGRETLNLAVESLAEGARNALSVGVACALVGVIIGTMTLTGLGSNFVRVIVSVGEGNLFLSLVLTMLTCLVLGMGILPGRWLALAGSSTMASSAPEAVRVVSQK